jgi:hypothetical protein
LVLRGEKSEAVPRFKKIGVAEAFTCRKAFATAKAMAEVIRFAPGCTEISGGENDDFMGQGSCRW